VSTAAPALYFKSEAAHRRGCDAFLSHSWHDDASAKWDVMQQWRQNFVAAHGREPRVWLDRCCIDQNNIERDLRCLPVFLSGCRSIVVFCGVTFVSRLWCIMELFTFVYMCRGDDTIQFQFVLRPGREEEDLAEIEKAFDSFDAEKCACAVAADKERMLSIIHTAFGSMAGFNLEVRAIFRRVRCREDSMRSSSSSQNPSVSSGSEEDIESL